MEGATLSRADLRRSFNVAEWGGGGGNTREARLRRSGHMLVKDRGCSGTRLLVLELSDWRSVLSK